jgi:hypothetical protein
MTGRAGLGKLHHYFVMKPNFIILLISLASAASLPAAVTITVANNTPNGTASGGSGTGAGAISTTFGSISSNLGMPVTTYTVSNVDLTSVGGTATESFTFTVSYTATSDGVTPASPQFNGFGNVSVTGGDNNQVSGGETLTATIALTSTSFPSLSLVGFTSARAGGVGAGEVGTFTWTGGGSYNITTGPGILTNSVTGNFFTLAVSTGTMNIEGFGAQFVAIPEPASATLLALVAAGMLRRRRSA